MRQTIQSNAVATSSKTDALVQAAIDDATGNNTSVTSLFMVILVAFFAVILIVRKKHKGTIGTSQVTEYRPLSEKTTSDVLNLARHGHSSSSKVFDKL